MNELFEHAGTAIEQSEVISFNFNGSAVRTLKDANGEPWFVAKDVAEILGYTDTQAMTRRLDDDEISSCTDKSSGQGRRITIINESGLYNAILGSNKPEAKVFKRWVTSEVLPSIRKFFKSKIVSENGKHLLDKTANSDYICRRSRNAMIDKKVSHAVINALPAQKHVKDGFFVFRRRIAEKFKTFFYVLWLLPEQVAYRWCCCNGAFSPVPVKGFFVTIKEER